MRERSVFPETAKNPTLNAEVAKRRRAIICEFILRHSVAHCGPGRAISHDRKIIRLLHERELRRRFVHATAGGNRRGANKLEPRRRLPDPVKKKEAYTLFDSDAA